MNSKITKKIIKNEYYNLKPDILIVDNLRHVKPYEFKYQVYAKGRWIDRKLLDVLNNEFKQYSEEHFLESIKKGTLLINQQSAKPDQVLRRGDFITHIVIRRENPIINKKLEIVHDDDCYLVVNKPPSWPVHVCGGYQFNTLHRILMDEYKYEGLFTLHRLDKHTSGIVIFAKNKEAADKFRLKLHTDQVGKVYYCRVKGKFPHDSIIVKRGITYVDKNKGIYTDCEYIGEENNEGSDSEEEKGPNKDPIDIKYAETLFEKQFYDESSNTSVVLAKPKTGRTHQIRIHLRYLGFPIANDPCYGGVIYNDLKEYNIVDPSSVEQNPFIISTSSSNEQLSVSEIFCYRIWLHAWNYKFGNYEFKTTPPDWANSEYKLDKTF